MAQSVIYKQKKRGCRAQHKAEFIQSLALPYTSMEDASLAALPPDVIKQVLRWLDARDLARIACVSKLLASAAASEELWQAQCSRWKRWATGRYEDDSWAVRFKRRWEVIPLSGP